jgi:hypothetical protein
VTVVDTQQGAVVTGAVVVCSCVCVALPPVALPVPAPTPEEVGVFVFVLLTVTFVAPGWPPGAVGQHWLGGNSTL